MVEHPLFSAELWRNSLNADEWENVLRADPCAYCGGPGGTLDHIVPLQAVEKGSYGRSSPKMNGTGSCADCNVTKAHTPLLRHLLNRMNTPPPQRIRDSNTKMLNGANGSDRFMTTNFFSPEQIEAMREVFGDPDPQPQ